MSGPGTYLDVVNGRRAQRLAAQVSAGAATAGEIPRLGGDGRLHPSMMPVGIGADTASIVASENMPAGRFVDIWNNGGTPNVRMAVADVAGKEADGFILEEATAGQPVTVYFEGRNTQLAALVPGTRYYLSAASPGAPTATPPSDSGNVVQFLGVAIDSTSISFEADDGVILA